MAEQQGMAPISLSQSSDEESSQAQQRTPQSSTGQPANPPSSKKPRGRPPGSKNKPKPPLVINQVDNDNCMKPVIIEVAPGTDAVEAITQFANRRGAGITIMSGAGTVSVATLRHPLSHAPAFTLHGPFTLLSLSGTYMHPSSPPPPPPPLPLPSPPPPPSSCTASFYFGVSFAGSQGQLFGGVVAGKVVAGVGGLKMMATMFRNPELHRAGGIIDEAGDEGDDDHNNPNADQGGAAAGGSGSASDHSMSGGFNIANIPASLPNSDPSVMHWPHPHPHPHPPNY